MYKDKWINFKKLSKEELRKKLKPHQFHSTQEDGTEPAYDNEYWDNWNEGIYVDLVSGEPLFSSKDKFESKTGWPSFTKPLMPEHIEPQIEKGPLRRVEVHSFHAKSHLGHVFDDGPEPTGLRYCMNSASLRFIPKEDLEREGYEEYKNIF